ncbi:c-type heme family protein [Adlercreutzia equolifaciens]|uniref:ATP-binding protein n=1 Tax=Adlercreutzia equolifaciens TaxID=446660 RepID=UPI003AB29F67
MSTDHPGRPFRYGIRFKIAVSIGVIMVALMAVDILWNLSLQNAQAENEAREKAEVLASEMRAAWDFVDMNQDVINRAEDGTFRTKHLVCVVAAKSISMLFTTETDYSIRFTNDTPRQAANAPDEFEQEALAAFNADPERKAFWRVVDAGDGTRVFRYTEPLYVTESCLECHGDPVGELDQYGYPKEGMQVGQVGGAMSITEPMDIYAAGIQDSMMQQAIMVLFMMVAAFIGLYFVTSRLVLRPIDELRSAAGAVGKGDFNYTLTVPDPGERPRDELAELTGEFDRMARDLEALYADLEGQVRSKTDDLMVLNDMLNYQKRELKVALDRLGDEVAYKNEFFAIVSHELRTPLTSILAYARILNADDSLAPKTREAVGEIESNATLLLNMVNNILVISKHAAKKDELLPEPVDFVDLAQFVRKALVPIAEGKDVRLSCSVAPDVPLSMADWEKLRRILENLVNNAIKYTHRGGFVRLTIGFESGEEANHGHGNHPGTHVPDDEDAAPAGWIVMRVADDGMGIAPEELDQIFELYKQAGQSANRRYRGTGLGLAVVRDLTELHGGTVTVESRVKEGSTFTVRIPYVPVIEEEDEEA